MKKSSHTEAELKKAVLTKKSVYPSVITNEEDSYYSG